MSLILSGTEGISGSAGVIDAATFAGQANTYYTDISARLGYTPLSNVNPSYSGTLTGNTGIINIGSGQVYKDSSGNVGLGTSSPGAKLDVSGADALIHGITVGRGGGFQQSSTAIGLYSLGLNTSGTNNTAVGNSTLTSNQGGANNTAVGLNVLRSNSNGNNNTGIGTEALFNNTSGGNNTAVGFESLYSVEAGGNNNVAVGYRAGRNITTGSGNTILGVDILGSSTLTNTVLIGSGGTERMRIDSSGNVGIGVTPSAWSTASSLKAIQMPGPSMWGTQGVGYWSVNTVFSDNAFKYIASDVASRYSQVNGAHQWSSAPAGTAGENATFNIGMRLNDNGRLGIGTILTPVELTLSQNHSIGWLQTIDDSIPNIFRQANSGALVLGSGVKHSVNSNAFASSYASAWARSAISVGYGAITFNVAPEATVAIGTDTTVNERMRINSSGNVGIGTNNPVLNSTGKTVHLNAPTGEWSLFHATNGNTGAGGADGLIVGMIGTDGYVFNYEVASLIFGTSASEFMRINADGRLLFRTTVAPSNSWNTNSAVNIQCGVQLTHTGNAAIWRQLSWSGDTADTALFFPNQAGNVPFLSAAGAWTNASDGRLKTNVRNIEHGLESVISSQPRSYTRTDCAGNYIGFVAQELKEIIPEVVLGSEETQYGVDYGSLVAVAFKAIQELKSIIDQQDARIKTLEGNV
jgi:hypothetical protein